MLASRYLVASSNVIWCYVGEYSGDVIHGRNGMGRINPESIAFQVFDRVMVLVAQVLVNKPFHGLTQTSFV